MRKVPRFRGCCWVLGSQRRLLGGWCINWLAFAGTSPKALRSVTPVVRECVVSYDKNELSRGPQRGWIQQLDSVPRAPRWLGPLPVAGNQVLEEVIMRT